MKVEYHEVLPFDQAEAADALMHGDDNAKAQALLRLAYHEQDWRWVQDWCLRLAYDDSIGVRRIAVTCLGHLARIHGQLDLDQVLPVLLELQEDPSTSGYVNDTLDDVRVFLKPDRFTAHDHPDSPTKGEL